MKVCISCKTEKDCSLFHKDSQTPDRLKRYCKDCRKQMSKEYKSSNKDLLRERTAKDKLENPEKYKKWRKNSESRRKDKIKEYKKKYLITHRSEINKRIKEWLDKNPDKKRSKVVNGRKYRSIWKKNNRDVVRFYSSKRRASLLNAMPPWVDKDHRSCILEIYKVSKLLEKHNNTKYHVDHIEPLIGKNSSGLHVWWNLRVIPEMENLSKGNKIIN